MFDPPWSLRIQDEAPLTELVLDGHLAIFARSCGYPGRMTKRLIDVDDEKLAAVRDLLGTRTLKDTVDNAFDEVLALAQRRQDLLADRGADLTALADPADREAAWG